MPSHDWTRVDANLFHDFHQAWTVNIANVLNGGRLPKGFSALVEAHDGHPSREGAAEVLASLGNRVTIRRPLSKVVAAMEIVSPGNKSSRSALRRFVEKTVDFLNQGVHVLVVD